MASTEGQETRVAAASLHAKELVAGFGDGQVKIRHVEREKNRGADALANMAIDAHVKKAAPRG